MKLCICSTGPNLEAMVSPVFGRCPYFLIVDSETEKFKSVSNPAAEAGRGAGVQAAQIAASEKAAAVICGNFGPNAFSVLQMANIKIYAGVFGITVKQALDDYKKGKLKETATPMPGGMGRGRGGGFGSGGGRGQGFDPGPGGRRGGGFGRGRR